MKIPLLCAASLCSATVCAEPIVKDVYTPDPAPVVDGDTLWVFTGHDMGGSYFTMPDWQVLSTKDMKTWTNHGTVLKTDVFSWAKQGNDAWASQAIKRDGKWYWYVACGDNEHGGIHGVGVAVADTPTGPWTDPIGKALIPGDWGCIDPSVFIDDDGQAWLFWGNNNCWYAPLKKNMVEIDVALVKKTAAQHPELQLVKNLYFRVPGLDDESAFGKHKLRNGKPHTNFEEAPWIYKRGDTYYLEYAAGGVPEHWAYSTAKSIHGPWTYRGKILAEPEGSFTIHGGSVAFKGKNYCFYHEGTAPGGGGFARSTAFKEFKYNPDGSIPFLGFHEWEVKAYQTEGRGGGLGLMLRNDGTGEWFPAVNKNHAFTHSNLGNWGQKKLFNPKLFKTKDGTWHIIYQPWAGAKELAHAASWSKHNLREWGRQRILDPVKDKDLIDAANASNGEWKLTPEEYETLVKGGEWKKFCPWHMTLDRTKDDQARYPKIAAATKLVLKLDEEQQPYKISDKLVGIFFEDINHSKEVYVGPGPDTFKGHGWRKDIAQAIADMKPKFMRFPGGCIVHGSDIANTYRWKDTVGPVEQRKPKPNMWGYEQDYKLGYFEYFQFCEDIGMEPLPVVSAGVCCPNPQRAMTEAELEEWTQDIVDLIEFAKGDPKKNKWAKLRAEMGHPKPFRLNMIGVGNEDDITDMFEHGFRKIVAAIKQRDPKIEIVGTAGAMVGTRDYEEGWKLSKQMKLEYVDEHYYVSPGWIYGNQRMYESYDREGPKVYAGEYAAHKEGRVNDMETALSCAVMLCNYEKNGDVVAMTSYAPLFAKKGKERWKPDMIYFTDDSVELTTDYWTQWVFGNFAGDKFVPSHLEFPGSEKTLGNRDDEQRFRNRFASSVVKKGNRTIVKLVNSTQFDLPLELPELGKLRGLVEFKDGKIRREKGAEVPKVIRGESMIVLLY